MWNNKIAPLLVIIAASLWGSMGLFVRKLSSIGLNAIEIVFIRSFFSFLLLLIVILIKNRKLLTIRWKDVWCFIGTGIASLLFFNLCYFKTIILTSLSIAAILLYTAPIFVTVLSVVLFKEKFTARKFLALVVALIGCVLVTGAYKEVGNISTYGIIVGLGSGLGYGLYSIFGRYAIERKYSPITITFYTFLFASMGALLLIDSSHLIQNIRENRGVASYMMALVLVATIIPYIIYTKGLEQLEASKAAIIACVEPAVATAIGIIVFREHIDVFGYVGIFCVFLSILIINSKNDLFQKKIKKIKKVLET